MNDKDFKIYTALAEDSKDLTEQGYLCIYVGNPSEMLEHRKYNDENVDYCAFSIPDLMLEDDMLRCTTSVYESKYLEKLNKIAEWRIYACLQEAARMINHNCGKSYDKIALVSWVQPGRRNSRHILSKYLNRWLREHNKPEIVRLTSNVRHDN